MGVALAHINNSFAPVKLVMFKAIARNAVRATITSVVSALLPPHVAI